MNAPTELALRLTQASQGLGERDGEFIEVVRSAVGQVVVGLTPDAFVGVEFRGIGRETFQMKATVATTELSDRFALVRLAIVPHDDEVAAEVAEQVAQELAGLGLLDVLTMQLEIQADAPAVGTDGEGRDGRNLVVLVVIPGPRGLAARPPGSPNRGDQQEAGFVDEGDMGPQPRGVFFRRGQSRHFHCSMAASSRCNARRSGFWQLQFSECSKRPTWSRW